MPGLKLELGAEEMPMREVQQPGEEGMVRGRLPVTRICVQPYVQGLHQGLAVLLAAGTIVERVVPGEQQLEHLTRGRERPIRRQEDVYVR